MSGIPKWIRFSYVAMYAALDPDVFIMNLPGMLMKRRTHDVSQAFRSKTESPQNTPDVGFLRVVFSFLKPFHRTIMCLSLTSLLD